LTGDDEFERIFGGKPPALPQQSGFAERLMAEAQNKGYLRPSPGQASAAGPAESTAGTGLYKPYGYLPAGNVGDTCDVRRWMPSTDIAEGIEFQYRFLMQVGYIGAEQLRLFLPDLIVVIEGAQLTDLRRRLARRQVTFIQQYSARQWPTPPTGEPLVDKIEIVRPEPRGGN
jgi:hypothetical protein